MFKICWAIVLIVILCVIPIISHADNKPRVYAYVDIGSDFSIEIDEVRGGVVIGDFGINATFCSSKSAYYCVNSDLFFFAVPKHMTKETKTWTVAGHTYTVASPFTKKKIFGSTVELCIITTSSSTKHGGHGTTYYYYSPRLGLIAYGDQVHFAPGDAVPPPTPYPTIGVSTDPIGFGAER